MMGAGRISGCVMYVCGVRVRWGVCLCWWRANTNYIHFGTFHLQHYIFITHSLFTENLINIRVVRVCCCCRWLFFPSLGEFINRIEPRRPKKSVKINNEKNRVYKNIEFPLFFFFFIRSLFYNWIYDFNFGFSNNFTLEWSVGYMSMCCIDRMFGLNWKKMCVDSNFHCLIVSLSHCRAVYAR